MEEQTKNIIMREYIEKELRFHYKADIRSTLVLCGGLSLFFVPLAAGVVYGIFALLKTAWIEILLSVLIAALTSAPIWINLLPLRISIKERKLLRNGDFDIAVCKVQYKDEKTVRQHTEKFLHFVGYKEISVGNAIYDLTSQGDEFYIVHYKGYTDIKLLYSLKTYVLKEE